MKTALFAALLAVTATTACAHDDGRIYSGHGHGHDHELGHHHDGHTHTPPIVVVPAPVCNNVTKNEVHGNIIWYYTYDCYGRELRRWSERIHYNYNPGPYYGYNGYTPGPYYGYNPRLYYGVRPRYRGY